MPDFGPDFSNDFAISQVGTTPDMVSRIRATLAPWFPDPAQAPVLTSILTAQADLFAFIYQYLAFAKLQTRISSATGGWLDLIAWDFFGARFARRGAPLELDASFRPRLLQEILRPRATRAAVLQMLSDLTGNTAIVREPWNTGDMGSYRTGTMGYGMGLGYGSLAFPDQIFVDAYRPVGGGIPVVAGYGSYSGGYGVGELAYIDMSQVTGLTDAEIFARVAQTVAAGITAWVDILGVPVPMSLLESPAGPVFTAYPGGPPLRSQ